MFRNNNPSVSLRNVFLRQLEYEADDTAGVMVKLYQLKRTKYHLVLALSAAYHHTKCSLQLYYRSLLIYDLYIISTQKMRGNPAKRWSKYLPVINARKSNLI